MTSATAATARRSRPSLLRNPVDRRSVAFVGLYYTLLASALGLAPQGAAATALLTAALVLVNGFYTRTFG
jgi:hypothetical protein